MPWNEGVDLIYGYRQRNRITAIGGASARAETARGGMPSRT